MTNLMDMIPHLGAWGQHHTKEVLLGLCALPVLAGVAGLVSRRRREVSQVMGSARWATLREVQRAGLTARHGVVVGRQGRQILCDDSNTHVLLCGPTRS